MDEKRKSILQGELKRISTILKDKYSPEKIIVFGSIVNGDIQEWSDIDLFIIKNTGERFYERLKKVALLTHPKVGIDFIVFTPEELKNSLSNNSNFIKEEVLAKGEVIYETGKQ